MRLAFSCRKCYRRSTVPITYPSRAEAKDVLGDEFMQTCCSHCGYTEEKHLNDIYAIADWRIYLIGGVVVSLISLLMVFLLLYLVGIFIFFVYMLVALILSFPILLWKWQNNKAHKFNLNRIERNVR